MSAADHPWAVFWNGVSPELELLLRSLAAVDGEPPGERVAALLRGPCNPDKLLWLAQRHGLVPRLFRALGDALPPDLRAALKRASQANAFRSLEQLQELKGLEAACREAGIAVTGVAAPVLGTRLHGDPARFRAGALDLLCPAHRQDDAARLIHAELGYAVRRIDSKAPFLPHGGPQRDMVRLFPVNPPAEDTDGLSFPGNIGLFRLLATRGAHARWGSLGILEQLADLWRRAPGDGLAALQGSGDDPSPMTAALLVQALFGVSLPAPAQRLLAGADLAQHEATAALERLVREYRHPADMPLAFPRERENAAGPARLGEFAPTPPELIEPMLNLAQVGPEDLCIDLGCGDGRILIEAVRRHGCRGIGYDIDPDLVERAHAAARAAGMEDRLRFVCQDVMTADLGEASVLFSWLRTPGNLALLPRLREMLRPATRIVTRDFHFNAWVPQRAEVWSTESPAKAAFLYLWRW